MFKLVLKQFGSNVWTRTNKHKYWEPILRVSLMWDIELPCCESKRILDCKIVWRIQLIMKLTYIINTVHYKTSNSAVVFVPTHWFNKYFFPVSPVFLAKRSPYYLIFMVPNTRNRKRNYCFFLQSVTLKWHWIGWIHKYCQRL